MKNEGFVIVSTDVHGIGAKPEEVEAMYKAAGFAVGGLEVVAMPRQYGRLVSFARGDLGELGYQIGGIHGPLGVDLKTGNPKGVIDWAKVVVVDAMMPSIREKRIRMWTVPSVGKTAEAVGNRLHKKIYLNVHNDAVAYQKSAYLDYAMGMGSSHLTVENGIRPGDDSKAAELVCEFKGKGAVETTGTYDLVHGVLSRSYGWIDMESVKKHWSEVLEKFGPEHKYVHLPIGKWSPRGDSLPIMKMIEEKAMLGALVAKIDALGLQIVLENQQDLLFGVDCMVEQGRLRQIRDGLLNCGFRV